MKIIVTGAKGFIGENLVRRLQPDHEVIELDTKCGKDLFDYHLFGSADVVVHLAALASVQESFRAPDLTMDINVGGTQHILNQKPKHLIFASSGSVSDPISPYAASKVAAEALIQRSMVPATILRFGNVYGPGDDKSAIYHFTKDKILRIYGDGSQRRSFVHVEDIVDAINLQLFMRNIATFALGHEEYSILDVAKLFRKPILFEKGVTETHTYPIHFAGFQGWEPKRKLKDYIDMLY